MEFHSEINNKYYVAEEQVFVDFIIQAIRYIKHHISPIDLIQSSKGRIDKITFVFKKRIQDDYLKKKEL